MISRLLSIARSAGAAILDIYHQPDSIALEYKADDSPLTAADRAANGIICQGLDRLPVKYPIISEENNAIPYAQRQHFETFWLVDPLDGTKEFVKRNGDFTVNLALIHQQQPILGIVYAPVQDEIYWAEKGQGAFMLRNNVQQRLQATTFHANDIGLRIVASRSHLNQDTQQIIDQFQSPILTSRGSSLKFMLLASGQAHYYPRLAPTMEWDTAAAQIILEEAGGSVLRYDDHTPLRYNKENLLNPYFIAKGVEVG